MKLVLAACLAVTIGIIPLAASADDLPTPQAIRDRSAAAAGPTPDAYRETIAFNGTTGSGVYTYIQNGKDHLRTTDMETGAVESGVYHGTPWHENVNGHVVIDADDPGLAAHETFTEKVERVTTPVDALVIDTLNSRGDGTRTFYDPTTYLVIRREQLTPNGLNFSSYSDFAKFGKQFLATKWSEHRGETAIDSNFTVRDYRAGGVTDAEVAMPSNRRMLVEFPPGADRVILPSYFAPDGHVILHTKIGTRGLDYLLDTGASTITIDPAVAKSLGLTVTTQYSNAANAGRYETGDAVVAQFDVGPLTMRDVHVAIVPLGFQSPGVKAVGLLGFDFLCEEGITIDYQHHQVIAERYGTYKPPADPKTIALDVRLGSQIPLTTVKINGAIAERMGIDTGGAGPFLLFDYFTRRYPDAISRSANEGSMMLTGAGGNFKSDFITIRNFTLGNVIFKDFHGFRVASRTSYNWSQDGVIGPTFLSLFDVHLDYPNGAIYLVPNAVGSGAMR